MQIIPVKDWWEVWGVIMDKTGKTVKLQNKHSNIAVNGFPLTAKTVKGTLLITLLT